MLTWHCMHMHGSSMYRAAVRTAGVAQLPVLAGMLVAGPAVVLQTPGAAPPAAAVAAVGEWAYWHKACMAEHAALAASL